MLIIICIYGTRMHTYAYTCAEQNSMLQTLKARDENEFKTIAQLVRCASLLFRQSVQNDSQAIAEVLNQLKDMLANFRGSEKYCYLQNEIFGLFQKLENINGVTDGYLNR